MNSNWPKNKVARLIELHELGWPASKIAIELHTTRNAVIGKCDRLGLIGKKDRVKTKRTKSVSVEQVKPVAKKPIFTVVPKTVPYPIDNEFEFVDEAALSSMWVFRDNSLCKWPGTNCKSDPVFECDELRSFNRPYCECHWQRSIFQRKSRHA